MLSFLLQNQQWCCWNHFSGIDNRTGCIPLYFLRVSMAKNRSLAAPMSKSVTLFPWMFSIIFVKKPRVVFWKPPFCIPTITHEVKTSVSKVPDCRCKRKAEREPCGAEPCRASADRARARCKRPNYWSDLQFLISFYVLFLAHDDMQFYQTDVINI